MSVFTWGRAFPFGAPTTGSTAPEAVDLHIQCADATPVAVAAGYRHSLALYGDGGVWSLGHNTEGQLGRRGAYHNAARRKGLDGQGAPRVPPRRRRLRVQVCLRLPHRWSWPATSPW